jgi:hypothetical protein
MFTDSLSSNGCHILARVGSSGNVFIESLPSNGYTRHNIFLILDNLSDITKHRTFACELKIAHCKGKVYRNIDSFFYNSFDRRQHVVHFYNLILVQVLHTEMER